MICFLCFLLKLNWKSILYLFILLLYGNKNNKPQRMIITNKLQNDRPAFWNNMKPARKNPITRRLHPRVLTAASPPKSGHKQKGSPHCEKRYLDSASRRWCGRQDLNLHGRPPDPKSGASANSATPAYFNILYNGRPSVKNDLRTQKAQFPVKELKFFNAFIKYYYIFSTIMV